MSIQKTLRHTGQIDEPEPAEPPAPPEPPAPTQLPPRTQAEVLAQLSSVRAVPLAVLERLAALGVLRVFEPGAQVVQDRAAAFVYLVLHGHLNVTLHDRLGHRIPVGRIVPGEAFGEGPLFGDLFRNVSAYAETTCYLVQLPLEDVRGVVADSPELGEALRMTYLRRLIESSLARVPLFSKLPPPDRVYLTQLLQAHHYERGEMILREGTHGEALYIIEAGQVAIERNGHVIAHLDEGNFFGEMSLLTSEPHNANVYALTPVDVLALPAANFLRLLEQLPALADEVQKTVSRRRQTTTTILKDADRAQRLAVAVDHGLLRGTHLLVRDQELCEPGCRLCEDACASRHGHTRLRLPGVAVDGFDVADACRQCRFGAECVEACPEDAIQWNDGGVLMITDKCTGCGECVPACPYDAMQLVPLAAARTPLWSLWHKLKRRRAPTIPLEPFQQTARADKCDFCHGYDDQACVSACPTGALRLVPLQEVFPL